MHTNYDDDKKIVAELLSISSNYYFATSVDNEPHIWMFGGVTVYDDKITVVIDKIVREQIEKNPKVEILAVLPGAKSLTVRAIAFPCSDSKAVNQLLDQNYYLAKRWEGTETDVHLACLTKVKATLFEFPEKKTIWEFE